MVMIRYPKIAPIHKQISDEIEINFIFSVPIEERRIVANDQESSAYIEQFTNFFLIFVIFEQILNIL